MASFDSQVIFSLRTKRRNQNAGLTARRVVKGLGTAGGHGMIAGGQIVTKGMGAEEQEKICESLRERFLRLLGRENVKMEKLIPR